MSRRNGCPAGCGRVQQPGKFLCRTCWYEVPAELRADLMRTWRRYSKLSARHPEFVAASRAYRAARNACLAAL